MLRPAEGHLALPRSIAKGKLTKADLSKGLLVGRNFDVDLESGIEDTQVNLRAVQHKPKPALRLLQKPEKNDDAALRNLLDSDEPSQNPHQMVRIEVFVPKVVCAPFVSPYAESFDYRPKLLPRNSEEVLVTVSLRSL
jgi:hypothetical protein